MKAAAVSKKKARRSRILKDIDDVLISKAGDEDVEQLDLGDTKARLVEADESSDEDEVPSQKRSKLRARNQRSLADVDKRYRGKKVSRKDLNDDDNVFDEKTVEEDHAKSELGYMFEVGDDEDFEDEEDEDEASDDQDEDEEESDEDKEKYDDDFDIEYDEDNEGESEEKADQKKLLFGKDKKEDEVKKGRAIKAQLALWEDLLEIRIQMQKISTYVNRLPRPPIAYEAFTCEMSDLHKTKLAEAQGKLRAVMESLLQAQENSTPAEMEDEDVEVSEEPAKKKRKLEDFESLISERVKSSSGFRDSTVELWNEKTKSLALASASAGGKSSFNSFETSTMKQIENILSDKERLIERTKLKRSDHEILGSKIVSGDSEGEDEDENNGLTVQEKFDEIFDDTDFYHHLLKDLIDRKTANVSDPLQLGKHWLQVQKLRAKMKKKSVDTKASKGRKTRYDIHAKLVNFMAPVYSKNSTSQWRDEAKNELFSSLFGGYNPDKESEMK